MTTWDVIEADVLDWAPSYEGEPFHAMLTDSPYEMSFMGSRWDRTGISFQPSTWAALAEHLLPGAFIMAFASSRGWHRLAVAIEDAGMVIQPSIFGWVTGQSFPKSTRLDTQIDRAAGFDQEVIGHKAPTGGVVSSEGSPFRDDNWKPDKAKLLEIRKPATPLARAWEGHRYGGQILKNSLEPIICAQKPWEGKRLDCIVETGAGSLWVEGGRISGPPRNPGFVGPNSKNIWGSGDNANLIGYESPKGRWPSNFVLSHVPPDADGNGGCVRVGTKRVKGDKRDGSIRPTPARSWKNQSVAGIAHQGHADADGLETVETWHCQPACPIRKIGEQSGERASFKGFKPGAERKASKGKGGYHGDFPDALTSPGHDDRGTCARYFLNCDWSYEVAEQNDWAEFSDVSVPLSGDANGEIPSNPVAGENVEAPPPTQTGHCGLKGCWRGCVAEKLAESDPVRYVSKAAVREREAGLFGAVGCAKCKGLETIVHIDDDGREVKCRRNSHSTVKPLSLLTWLAKLLAPPPEYAPRRLLVPFSGSGSEISAAVISGCWEEIVGIELEGDYVDISRARLRFWQGWSERSGETDPKAILKLVRKEEKKRKKEEQRKEESNQLELGKGEEWKLGG